MVERPGEGTAEKVYPEVATEREAAGGAVKEVALPAEKVEAAAGAVAAREEGEAAAESEGRFRSTPAWGRKSASEGGTST